jgi:hypothetical protein
VPVVAEIDSQLTVSLTTPMLTLIGSVSSWGGQAIPGGSLACPVSASAVVGGSMHSA